MVVANQPEYNPFFHHDSPEYHACDAAQPLQIAPRFSSCADSLGASCEATMAPMTNTAITTPKIAKNIALSFHR